MGAREKTHSFVYFWLFGIADEQKRLGATPKSYNGMESPALYVK